MDADQFDRLSKLVSRLRSRRGLLGLLAALPLGGAVTQLADLEETDAAGRRKRRKKRHKHQSGDAKQNRKGKHKGHKKKQCRPAPVAQTCADRCAQVTNNCGAEVDCGPCDCGACPVCQTCNPDTGLCIPDPATDGGSCGDGRRCVAGQCVCDGTSCATGCCDDADVCHVDDADACGAAGGTCTPCASSGEACEAGACCTTAGNPATGAVPCCAGLNQCDDDICRADCCGGVTCNSGVCQDPGACDPATGICSSPTPNTGASCNDGNPCTIDVCQAGVCTPSGVNEGVVCGDGQVCQANGSCRCGGNSCGACRTCDASSGQCVSIACSVSEDCPGSCGCSGGICGTTPTCRRFRQNCTSGFQCCNTCGIGSCLCSRSGQACYDSSDCCGNPSPQACIGFVCHPI